MSDPVRFECLDCGFAGVIAGGEDITRHRKTGCKGTTSPVIDAKVAQACKHPSQQISAEVDYMEDSGMWMADIRITCAECGTPFEFVGVNAGLRFDRPMCDVSAQELRAPMRPKGSKALPGILGFEVKVQ